MKVSTRSGFEFEIDYEQISDDWEVVEMLVGIDEDGASKHPRDLINVATRIMGEEQFAEFKKYLKEKNGKVSTRLMLTTVGEILNANSTSKNS